MWGGGLGGGVGVSGLGIHQGEQAAKLRRYILAEERATFASFSLKG